MMRRLLATLVILFCASGAWAADTKVSADTNLATLASGDEFYCVDDPGGTPLSRACTIDVIRNFVVATTFTVAQGGTGATTLTDGGILLGSGTGAITALGVATNGQIPIGDGTTDPVLGTVTATANETDVTNGAGSITIGIVTSPTLDGTNFTGIPAAAIGNGLTDAQVLDTITASSYLPLAGGTMTAEFTADDLGVEFTAGDALTDCSTFAATGGGIFYDDSEGVFKKCQDNVLTVMDTTGGTPAFSDISGATNTTAAMVVGTGASLAASGSGAITATAVAASGITGTDAGTDLTADLEEESHCSEHASTDVSCSGETLLVTDDQHNHTTTTISGIVAADMGDADHGAVSWSSGVATVEDLACTNCVAGTEIALGSDAQGDVMYYNGTDWVRLAAGTSGHFLKTNGAAANPAWAAAGGSGSMPPIIFRPQQNEPPTSNFATLDLRNNHPVLDFDAATDESALTFTLLPAEYAGGGLTCDLYWAATTATSGDVVWNVGIEYMDDDTLDIDADSFAAVNAATCTAAGTSGILDKCTITFTDGADMDSWAAGNPGRIKVVRDADNGSDTMTGDAEFKMLVCNET